MDSLIPQILINALISGSHYAITAAGLALLYIMFGSLSFVHGYMVMCGAYAYLLFHFFLGMSVVEAAIGSVIVIALLQSCSYRFFMKPFLKGRSLLPFITTMVFGIVLENLVSIFFGVNVQSISPEVTSESREILGAYVTDFQIATIVSAAGILIFLSQWMKRTKYGRMIRACASSKEVAIACGIKEHHLAYLVCAIAGGLAALGGIAIGIETNLTPTMGGFYTIKAFAAMVLGGMGNLSGAILGSYLLALIEHFSIGVDIQGYSLPSSYKDAFSFFIIFVVLLLKPEGLFSWRKRRV